MTNPIQSTKTSNEESCNQINSSVHQVVSTGSGFEVQFDSISCGSLNQNNFRTQFRRTMDMSSHSMPSLLDSMKESTNDSTSSSSSSSNEVDEESESMPRLIAYVSDADDDCHSGQQVSKDDNDQKQQRKVPENLSKWQKLSDQWSKFIINRCHKPLLHILHAMAGYSARNPLTTITSISLLSFFLLTVGLFTNFHMNVDEGQLWTPWGSTTRIYGDWLLTESHFPKDDSRLFLMLLHANGKSVLTKNAVRMVFNATETLMKLPVYNDVCSDGVPYTLPNGTKIITCPISGVMRFWNYSSLIFDWTAGDDNNVLQTLSKPIYPDGSRVEDNLIFGKAVRDEKSGLLKSVKSFPWVISLPDTEKSIANELNFVDEVLKLNEIWQQNPATSKFQITVIAKQSFSSEFTRGILVDIPLVPFVIILMVAFSCLYFYRRDKVLSRSSLGVAAIAAITVSIMSGYGLMFIIGVPFTSMTQLIPFIIFGIGVDDAFILVDTFERTDSSKDPVERIHDTINECGVSITMTTITSTLAFASGLFSSIPAVNWLCSYATPTVVMVLLYQLTFFVGCIVLDERRVRDNRRDCCLWVKVEDVQEKKVGLGQKQTLLYRCIYYAVTRMLQPRVKAIIVLFFIVFLALCSWSTSQLTQAFSFEDVLPKDSYALDSVDSLNKYRGNTAVPANIIFRNVDFSDEKIQIQMEQFVIDIVGMTNHISMAPANFWLRDFKEFVQNSTDTVQDMPFRRQLSLFMNETLYSSVYKNQMGFDSKGKLVESICLIDYDKIDFNNVKSQIGALKDTYEINRKQPINYGLDESEFKFFVYSKQFNSFTFYSVCVHELISNTIMGIISVTLVALFLIPHWSAAIIIFPIVCMMYVDILGILNWGGIKINPVSFVSIIMSIGLIVDYQMHILLRYIETPGLDRNTKMTETLCTMGASVFAGGFSTFLGTVPLAFSTTTIFWTVFMSFISLVTVAIGHGIVFLPVLLATFGPVNYYIPSHPVTYTGKQQSNGDATHDVNSPPKQFSF